jgi:N-acetylglucosaminyl-diphospho-decaprenol L-rhamnosyltransferase
VTIDHVLLTRFNLPSKGPESLIRAQEGWLQRRVELFQRYTIPSVAAQTVSGFHWIVYIDPESPPWLLERLTPHAEAGAFSPIFREEAHWRSGGAPHHHEPG